MKLEYTTDPATRDAIKALMDEAAITLRNGGVPDHMRDLRRLSEHFCGCSMQPPYDDPGIHAGFDLSPEGKARFRAMIAARAAGRPVSKIIGRRAFWEHEFTVTDDVLDPRPETETLVEHALAAPFERVLDLGTGSGCILVSLLAANRHATGTGADVSEAALVVARENAGRIGVLPAARFVRSDWLANIEGRFDLIVSNPPYLAPCELETVSREVRDHDPHLALLGGGDGLAAYRAIAAGAPAHLAPGGRLMVEIGPTQGAAVAAMFAAAGLETIRIHPDLDGRDRVVSGRMPANRG